MATNMHMHSEFVNIEQSKFSICLEEKFFSLSLCGIKLIEKHFFIFFLEIKEVLPEVLTHLGPKQLAELKDLAGKAKAPEGIKEEDGEDEVPDLVNSENFEKASESK